MIDPQLRKKLVHEDRWSRVFEVQHNSFAYESKFATEEAQVSITELERDWSSWNAADKLSFAKAFQQKRQITTQDERILEFLMTEGDEPSWSTIAPSLPLHSDRKMVLRFLLNRLQASTEPKANFIEALCVLGDQEALSDLRQLYNNLSIEVATPEGRENLWSVIDFLRCCEALAKLEKSEKYRDNIRLFLDNPNEIVRSQARLIFFGAEAKS